MPRLWPILFDVGGTPRWMENYRGTVSGALIRELVVLVEDGPRGSDAAAEHIAVFVPVECLNIVLVEDIHGKERSIERSVVTLCDLGDLPKWLKERARFAQNPPVFGCQIVLLQAVVILLLIPLDVLLDMEGDVQENKPRVPPRVIVQWQRSPRTLLKEIPPVVIISHVDRDIMDLSERPQTSPAQWFLCLELVDKVRTECSVIVLFNLFQSRLSGFL